MAILFGDNLDLQQLQVLNFVLPNLSSDPSGPVAGQAYYSTADNHSRVYNETTFRILPFITAATPTALTVAGGAAVGTSIDAARDDHAHAMPGVATISNPGFMSATDKTSLTNATPSNTVSTLVLRDAAARFQAADPVAAQDVATMNYVQTLINGYTPKGSVFVRATANILISNPGTALFDGVTVTNGKRVLLANQTAPAENGIYIFNGSAAAMTRSTDMDTFAEVVSAYTIVEQGTLYADMGFLSTADAGGTLGSSAINFIQFGNVTIYTASNDPAITGTGVYDNTTGSQFRFRAIKTGSTKLSVTLVSKDIVLDVVEANINLANLGGTLPVAKGGTGATTAAAAKTNLGFTTKYEVDIGNGALQTFTINHALGTVGVIVQVWENGGQKRQIFPRISIVDTNSVSVTFASAAPAASAYRVIVIG